MITFPDNLTKQEFLNSFWQQKPLLLQQVMEKPQQLISKEKLFNMSHSDDVESRLLLENGPDEPWQVFHGPQDSQQLDSLEGLTHWTLLVQSVNLWHKGCIELLKDFDFIPSWRLDDIMISYATESGTVGPHIDHYDVFLIQLSGTRRWIIGEMGAETQKVDPDSASQHIKPYPATIDAVLTPGDMLYLPPDTAHHGISIEPGMTLSVGFRSPALSEMMMIFAEQLMIHKTEGYYTDPQLNNNTSSCQISSASMAKAVHWFSDLEQFDELKRKAFGILQTQPKQELIYGVIDIPVIDAIRAGYKIKRDPAARMAWYQSNKDTIWLFINGECYERPTNEKHWIELLGKIEKLSMKKISHYISDKKFTNLLEIFVESGMFGIK